MNQIDDLRRQAEASRIINGELLKLKQRTVTNPTLQPELLVDANLQLDDINEARRVLRKNLATIVPIEKVDEIVDDPNIVDDSNVQLINDRFKEFARQLKDGTSRLSLDRFKDIFKAFIQKITNPIDQEGLNKLQYIEQALRDIAMEQSNFSPQIQKIIDTIDKQSLTIQSINDILDVVNNDEIDLNDIEEIIKNEDFPDSSPPVPGIPKWTLTDIKLDSNKLISAYGNDYKQKITPWKRKLKDILITASQQDVETAVSQLQEAELKAYQNLVTELSKTTEKKQVREILKRMNPVVREYRNNKIEGYVKSGLSPNEANDKTLDDSKEMFGYGLKNKSSVVSFGVLMLNISKLHNENKLKLTYKNGNMEKEIKLTSVSDAFIDMVNDILQGNKFNERKFKMLPEDEKYLYKMMLKKTKLAGDINVRLDTLTSSNIDKLKNEWAVTFGEINAGNNSKELYKRAKELINVFMEKRMISKTEGLKMLTNL